MEFEITRASFTSRDKNRCPVEGATQRDDGGWVIEIADLASLLALREKGKCGLIIEEDEAIITLYDDWVE